MPRLAQVGRETPEQDIQQVFDAVFGEGVDPITQPGTATGTHRQLVDGVCFGTRVFSACGCRLSILSGQIPKDQCKAAGAGSGSGRLCSRQSVRVFPAL